MIIQIRGTSGSGKSTLTKAVMSRYEEKQPNFVPKRKQPLSYLLKKQGAAPLFVVGHYETACGGSDTVKTLDQIFGMVKEAHDAGYDVLFEGMLLCSDTKRAAALSEEVKKQNYLAISLNTPIETCISNIGKRREAKGNDKEVNPANTIKRYEYEQKQIKKLEAAGVDIHHISYDDALTLIKEKLSCTQ